MESKSKQSIGNMFENLQICVENEVSKITKTSNFCDSRSVIRSAVHDSQSGKMSEFLKSTLRGVCQADDEEPLLCCCPTFKFLCNSNALFGQAQFQVSASEKPFWSIRYELRIEAQVIMNNLYEIVVERLQKLRTTEMTDGNSQNEDQTSRNSS